MDKLCFYSGRIRTLVAMATYIFHRLIMGKVKIDNFLCLSHPAGDVLWVFVEPGNVVP